MKLSVLNIACLVSATCAIAAVAANGPAATTESAAAEAGPKIQFQELVYNFGKVAAGEPIQHTFTVSNAGNATLVISGVRPSCGCTTAGAWTKEIKANKTGVIPIQIASSYLRGSVEKQVTVTSNDKSQPAVVLRMRGAIWKPVELTPAFAWLHLTPGAQSNNSTVIRISNKTDQPLTLSDPVSADTRFTGALKTIEAGKEFELTVTAETGLPPGNFSSSMTIKTSLTNAPVLTVPITAMSPQPAVLVRPPSIALSGGAPSQPMTKSVLIQATAPQPLTLGEASVNASGVDVQVKAAVPGRSYNLTLTFPQGFQIQPGQQLELSVKSNYPQFPVIRVPITQPPASAAVAARKG